MSSNYFVYELKRPSVKRKAPKKGAFESSGPTRARTVDPQIMSLLL